MNIVKAIEKNYIAQVKEFASQDKFKKADKEQILYCAIKSGNAQIVSLILENGAKHNCIYRPYSGYLLTPLELAVVNGKTQVVEEILKYGPNPNRKIKKKVIMRNYKVFKDEYYVPFREIEITNSKVIDTEKTALTLALERYHPEIVRLLLQNGADPNTKCNNDKPLIQNLVSKGHTDKVELLLQNNADPNKKYEDNQILLHIAAMEGHKRIATLLLQYGANPEAKCFSSNITPANIAHQMYYPEIGKLLKKTEENRKKLETLIGSLQNENYPHNHQQYYDEIKKLMLNKETAAYTKLRTLERLIKLRKKYSNLITYKEIAIFYRQIPFSYDFFNNHKCLSFALKNRYLNLQDMNGRTIDEALCIYPSPSAIPTIFGANWGLLQENSISKKHILTNALAAAKKRRAKKFIKNFYNTYAVCRSLGNPELAGKIIKFTNGELEISKNNHCVVL